MASETKVFDVTNQVGPKSGDAIGDEAEQARAENLVCLIRRTVAPDTWDCVGGSGAVKTHFSDLNSGPKWLLVAYQEADTAATITDIFDTIENVLTALGS